MIIERFEAGVKGEFSQLISQHAPHRLQEEHRFLCRISSLFFYDFIHINISFHVVIGE